MNYAGSLLFVIFLCSTALTGHFWNYLSRVRSSSLLLNICSLCFQRPFMCSSDFTNWLTSMPISGVSNVQEDGKKETASAATFFLESPWSSEECPQARINSAKPSSVPACFCNCQSRTPPGNIVRSWSLKTCAAGFKPDPLHPQTSCMQSRLPGTQPSRHQV